MSISAATLDEALKKRKRISKFYGFQTFCDPGCPIMLNGPFRENIRIFLQECANLEDYDVEGMPVWSTFLVHENKGFVLPLFTIEENIKDSIRPFCDHCRCAGWSHHFMSKKKYHLIIPVDEDWRKPLSDGALDLHSHLLHGMIHSNGFGHLLCINGIEGGSKNLCGKEIMDLWDRICNNLRARKITVEDISKKHMMDLRLLHGVAYGHPWFGRWGYRFFHGSFGVTQHHYEGAIEVLSSLQLDDIIHDFTFSERSNEIKKIICCYRDLSETNLTTIQDLLRFMLALKSRPQMGRKSPVLISPRPFCFSRYFPRAALLRKEKSPKCRKFSSIAAKWDSRWPARRLEFTAEVIVNALKEKKAACKSRNAVMSRQEVRDVARLQIGDTGLIDYVLKSMNNVVVGGYIIRRAVNITTRKLEYSIQEVKKDVKVQKLTVPKTVQTSLVEPGINIYKDISYLYSNVILGYPEPDDVKLATQIILDSKYFVKEWPFKDEKDDILRFICRLMPSLRDLESELTREFPNGEYVLVPLHATIGDLKLAIERAMRETYCIMDQLVITDIEKMDGLDDNEVLFGNIESGTELWVRGFGLDLDTHLRYEGGADNWTVLCKCGARDDDGERMVSCDMCEIWQHTRCCGIENDEAVPPVFICDACCNSVAPERSHLISCETFEPFGTSMLPIMPDMDMELLY